MSKKKSKLYNDTYTTYTFQTKAYKSIINMGIHAYMLGYAEREFWGGKMRKSRDTQKVQYVVLVLENSKYLQ